MGEDNKLLSPTEIDTLYEKMQNGDREARKKLIESNLKMAFHMANKYRNSGVEIDDLISSGFVGLIKGVDTFNPNKGNVLSTYLWKCIENEVRMLIRKNNKSYFREFSLHMPIYSYDGKLKGTMLDQVPGNIDSDPHEKYFKKERSKIIKDMISKLTPHEQEVILMRYGFIDDRPMTHREISKKFGVGRTTITRKEARILKKIKKSIPSNEYKHLL